MNTTQTSPDFSSLKTRARQMSTAALAYSITDCIKAAEAARALELAGCRVSKTEGYYMDEASVYSAELQRRS